MRAGGAAGLHPGGGRDIPAVPSGMREGRRWVFWWNPLDTTCATLPPFQSAYPPSSWRSSHPAGSSNTIERTSLESSSGPARHAEMAWVGINLEGQYRNKPTSLQASATTNAVAGRRLPRGTGQAEGLRGGRIRASIRVGQGE